MNYETIIGLEVHAQLKTRAKIFCDCPTDFGNPPNTQTCAVCLGMPGVLPVLNRQVVDFALRLALALNCEVAPVSIFARKNYFYPDLPKGYQISQFDRPLAERGYLDVPQGDGTRKRVGITRIHLEEDAGKNLHAERPEDEGHSFVDFNRTGVPLVEIVSEPDLRSPEEAAAYMRQLRRIVRYLGICDGNMQEGSLRCDANVSLRPVGQAALGTKTELKNMNSFKHVAKALDYEVARQTEALREGVRIVQETRLYSEAEGITRPMRSKEEAHDYRYFPEPDLVPLVVGDDWIASARAAMTELPLARADRFQTALGLSAYDAGVLTESRELADYFEAVLAKYPDAKKAANWVSSELLRELKRGDDEDLSSIPVPAENLARLLSLIDDGTISGKLAKTVFEEMYATGQAPDAIIAAKGLVQVSDRVAIEAACRSAIEKNPKQLAEYRSGKDKLLGFFVGQVMKETGGKANPQVLGEVLREMLKG
jgi:aspartyl-tRNA(Asn)/glutamyl-tRNA(Gln) amidotransferase subunit B